MVADSFGANSAVRLKILITSPIWWKISASFLFLLQWFLHLGFYPEKKKISLDDFWSDDSWVSYCFVIPTIYFEMKGNPAIAQMGIAQHLGSMEGKEVRFGPAASAYWGITTTVTSNGSVNSMHDSFTPLTGMFAMLGMMINCFLWRSGRGVSEFLHLHHHCCFHLRIDGGTEHLNFWERK